MEEDEVQKKREEETKLQDNRQALLHSFMEMVGLASRLPALTDAENKPITTLQKSKAGVRLVCHACGGKLHN